MRGRDLAGMLRERPEVYDKAGQHGDQQHHAVHSGVEKEQVFTEIWVLRDTERVRKGVNNLSRQSADASTKQGVLSTKPEKIEFVHKLTGMLRRR